MTSADMPYWPAAMNRKMAAAYCGICVDTFDVVCPVKPLRYTDSARGERYLRQRLDEWMLSLDPNKQDSVPRRKFGDRLNGGEGEARRA
jgi:hypothetical protein